MGTRKDFSKNILYFSNVAKAEKIVTYFLCISWAICIAINIGTIETYNIVDYFDHHTYIPLIGF
jgi:hypothetical protein